MIRSAAEVLLAIEQECIAYDAALKRFDWTDCGRSYRAQRLLTHELDIAMRALDPESQEAKVARHRIERIRRYRDGQLKKLQTFHANVGTKLTTMGRYQKFAKSRGTADRESSFLDMNS